MRNLQINSHLYDAETHSVIKHYLWWSQGSVHLHFSIRGHLIVNYQPSENGYSTVLSHGHKPCNLHGKLCNSHEVVQVGNFFYNSYNWEFIDLSLQEHSPFYYSAFSLYAFSGCAVSDLCVLGKIINIKIVQFMTCNQIYTIFRHA